MKKNYKDIAIYIFIFIFFFIILLFFNVRSADTIWNYGMAHALRLGEIPYKDFNIITTPLYPFLMSIFLWIKDTYFFYLFSQALLCTILFYFIKKHLQEKTPLYFLIISIPFFNIYLPNYNFMAFLLFIIILYMEMYHENNKWIGLLLGLLFITKHTIGAMVIALSLISTWNGKKIRKRMFYLMIPISIFVIYLFITKSINDFINLSILGLFDFGKHNSNTSFIYLMISFIILIWCGYSFIKNPKEKENFYLLSAFSFIIPIVNMDHCMYLIAIFLFIALKKINIFNTRYSKMITLIVCVLLLVFNFCINLPTYKVEPGKFSHFKYRFMSTEDSTYVRKILEKYKEYPNSYMISMDSMLYDIELGRRITYFDIPLYGNYGYNGIKKLKSQINNMHGKVFFVQDSKNSQFIQEVVDDIKKHGILIEELEGYSVYQIY